MHSETLAIILGIIAVLTLAALICWKLDALLDRLERRRKKIVP